MHQKLSILLALAVASFSCSRQPSGDKTIYISDDMTGWIPYTENMIEKETALDMSFLLDPPSGKNGFLTVQGDKFFFTDGTSARFWGANLAGEACFPDKEEAEEMAGLISRLGYNIVRLHHIDVVAPWSDKVIRRSLFGGQQPTTTRKVDAEMIDRLEYLWFCLKEKGVYIKLSHLSSRMIMKGDGFQGPDEAFDDVGFGLKLEGGFDPFLIGLQQEYLQQLLTHKNPYTGMSMLDDPTMAMMEIINEDALLYYGVGDGFSTLSDYYTQMLQSLFNNWLKVQFGSTAAIAERWSSPDTIRKGLLSNESLEKMNIQLLSNIIYGDLKGWNEQRVKDSYRFLYEKQLGYYQSMYAFLRKLGVKCPVTGSNHWINKPADLLANSHMDFIDRHTYWQHPTNSFNYDTGQVTGPLPMVRSDYAGNIGSLASRRVYGLPYTASEWHNPLPNKFRSEGPVIMAAVACLQDWHPMQYALAITTEKNPQMINSFEFIYDPSHMNVVTAASLMFHRGDFREAEMAYYEIIPENIALDPLASIKIHPLIALSGKYGIAFQELAPGVIDSSLLQYVNDTNNTCFRTESGDMQWDIARGLVIFNSAFTQGFAGFTGGQPVECDDVSLDVDNQFAVVIVTSLTDLPVAESGHILITTSGDSQWKGVKFNKDGKVIQRGYPPFIMEPITGSITLPLDNGCTVYKLSTSGRRLDQIPAVKTDQGIMISLQKDCLHYEILSDLE
jgi:hypothetical protein